MSDDATPLRETLFRIARLAEDAVGRAGHVGQSQGGYDGADRAKDHRHGHAESVGHGKDKLSCIPKTLPKRLLEKAAATARQVNPVNAPAIGPLATFGRDIGPMDPGRIKLMTALVTTKYWGAQDRTLTVSFMEATPGDLRQRIIDHLNAWFQSGCINFAETQGTGQVRISRGPGGFSSYLGVDILLIPTNLPTMNLEGFTMSTDESEYRRVVRHEAGHTLGFPHEHMRQELVARIDPERAYDHFFRLAGWDRRTVDEQVLTALDQTTIIGTPPDQDSIMCYQLPGSITRDGNPISGGADLNHTDHAFAAHVYPKASRPFAMASGASRNGQMDDADSYATDWAETDDVDPFANFSIRQRAN